MNQTTKTKLINKWKVILFSRHIYFRLYEISRASDTSDIDFSSLQPNVSAISLIQNYDNNNSADFPSSKGLPLQQKNI